MPRAKTPTTSVPTEENPFAAPAPAVPAVDAQQLVATLTQLQKDVAAGDRERAAAEAQLAQAQKDLQEINAHLKKMNVDPEQATDALAALEQELAALASQFSKALQDERAVYQQIAAASQ